MAKKLKDTSVKPVEVVWILDRSGSMQHLINDSIGGFNTALEGYKKDGLPILLTLVIFDDQYTVIYKRVPVSQVEPLTNKVYFARNSTALNDALGKTINEFIALKANDEVGDVVFSLMTDGEENASREYKPDAVKALVEKCTKDYNWQVNFLGANIDSFSTAAAFGIGGASVANYSATAGGVGAAMRGITNRSAAYAMNSTLGMTAVAEYKPMQDYVDDEVKAAS